MKSTLATVSGPTAAKAICAAATDFTSAEATRDARSAADQTATSASAASATAFSAAAKRTGSSANTRLGRSCRASLPRRSKVVDASEYELEMGATGTPTCIAASIISALAMLLSERIITGRSAVAPAASRAPASASTRCRTAA